MTIRRGEQWGFRIALPSAIRRVNSDAELAQCVSSDFISVGGGDLFRTVGSPQPVQDEDECTLLPIDALQIRVALIDGTEKIILASSRIEIGSLLGFPLRRRRYICITNGGIVDNRNLAPRAHPNNGKFDVLVLDKSMSFRDRWVARKKAVLGTHIPHPNITVRQIDNFHVQNDGRDESLSIDGIHVEEWSELSVTILPDYWQIVV
jgi:hypothetical protein